MGHPEHDPNSKRLNMEIFSALFWIACLIVLMPLIVGVLIIGAQKPVYLIHKESGIVKKGYVGYSWSYLFFGWFVPIFRGELGVGLLHLDITLFSAGLSQLIFPFIYNRQYMIRLLLSGWQLDTQDPRYEWAKIKLNIPY